VRGLTEDPLEAVERLSADSMSHRPEVTKLARRVFGPHRADHA
jgi:hypothetical protein